MKRLPGSTQDMALLTCNDEIITDINKVFAVLEGKMAEPTFRHLLVARFNMVPELIRMIHREIEHVKLGRKGRIVLKMNGLHDQNMINELYRASEEWGGDRPDRKGHLLSGSRTALQCQYPDHPDCRYVPGTFPYLVFL